MGADGTIVAFTHRPEHDMDLGLRGRRAVVAAGSAGLGLATAQALADEGVAVAICGRDEHRLQAAVAGLGPNAVGILADVSVSGESTRFAAEAEDLLGGVIDIAVLNAGGPPPGAALSTDLDAFRHAFELNTLSGIELAQAVVPSMIEQRWGRVVAITSMGARQPIPTLAASTSARAAITAFIKNLSTDVARYGITANTIQPGLHATDRLTALHDADDLERMTADAPSRRAGDAGDFGAIAAFLCSEPANYINGASLAVDGGITRGLQ